MEALCSTLDRRILTSRSFADEVGGTSAGLVSLGPHSFRGVEGTSELFAVAETWSRFTH